MALSEWPVNQAYTTGLAEIPDSLIEEQCVLARDLAYEYHEGQMYDDTCGVSFFAGHLTPVVEIGEQLCEITGHSRIIVPGLWLHDGVEDGKASILDMRMRGIIRPVTEMVDAMTRRPGEPYLDYLSDVAQDPDGAIGKLADSLGNMKTNLEFHDHDPARVVRKRLLRYPKNVARLAPISLEGFDSDQSEDVMIPTPKTREGVLEALVDRLARMRQVLAFDGTLSSHEIARELLTQPRQIAFLAPLLLGETVDPGLISEIRNGVLNAVEMV